MAIGDYEPGIVVVDVPSLGLCRLTPAEARAYIDLFEAGAGEDELGEWVLDAFDRRDEEEAAGGAPPAARPPEECFGGSAVIVGETIKATSAAEPVMHDGDGGLSRHNMGAAKVLQPIEMVTAWFHGADMGQVESEITYAADGSLMVQTRRRVKELELIGLPRRIESARDLIEAWMR